MLTLLVCVLYIIPADESVWWTHILFKICAFVHCVWKFNG